MRRENLLKGVWLGGGKKKKKMKWSSGVFFLDPPESFHPTTGRKLLRKFDLLI